MTLRRLIVLASFAALISSSTASIAADNSASWAALSALSTSNAQNDRVPENVGGLPGGASFFPGTILPIGINVAASVLAVVLASEHHHPGGRGFSPS